MKKHTKQTGAIFFEGPSRIDRAPIVGIAVYKSGNKKTGDMVQTYILRQDVRPSRAIKLGRDESICGSCRHRGDGSGSDRTCYVNVGRSIDPVWKKYNRGGYSGQLDRARMRGRAVRLGAYGDPAAIPLRIWRDLLRGTSGHTGYTHQWKRFAAMRYLCMASVDTPAEQSQAIARGWRTFRVRPDLDAPTMGNEIVCPASAEAGEKLHCIECKICCGIDRHPSAKNVVIAAHGSPIVRRIYARLLIQGAPA
jgi:hypothetical protein